MEKLYWIIRSGSDKRNIEKMKKSLSEETLTRDFEKIFNLKNDNPKKRQELIQSFEEKIGYFKAFCSTEGFSASKRAEIFMQNLYKKTLDKSNSKKCKVLIGIFRGSFCEDIIKNFIVSLYVDRILLKKEEEKNKLEILKSDFFEIEKFYKNEIEIIKDFKNKFEKEILNRKKTREHFLKQKTKSKKEGVERVDSRKMFFGDTEEKKQEQLPIPFLKEEIRTNQSCL